MIQLAQIVTKDTSFKIKKAARIEKERKRTLSDTRALVILKIPISYPNKPLNYKIIEEGIANLAGVIDVQINHATDSIKVVYDPLKLNLITIRESLLELQKSPSE